MRQKKSLVLTSSLLLLSPFALHAQNESPVAVKKETTATLKTPEKGSEQKQDTHFSAFTGKVTRNKVRLRVHPSIEGHVVRELNQGEFFAIVGEDNDFYAVQPPKETKGFVFRTFVLEDTVEGARVNIRLYPDTEAPVIGRLNSGDRIQGAVSSINSKWLEIDPPANTRFYIAKEYVEKLGPVDMLAKMESRRHEAQEMLNVAEQQGQTEVRKPFDEIDLQKITKNFEKIIQDFPEFTEITEKAKESNTLLQETYIQKKIAFLESKADRSTVGLDNYNSNIAAIDEAIAQKFSMSSAENDHSAKILATNTLASIGTSSAHQETAQMVATSDSKSGNQSSAITDKMRQWEPVEQTIYQKWIAHNGEKSFQEFYEEEEINATMLTGIVEPYTRPVKNCPGDFILRMDNLPVAFLYSTKINLQDKVGQKVTVMATPRPNNNFAFPAYYVLSVE